MAGMGLRATSHLSVRLTAMRVTVNEVSSHLCKILTLITVKTYLQTGRRPYRVAQRPVVRATSHLSLVSITRQMPRPRHENGAIIMLNSDPSLQSLCFDSKLVVVVVVIGLMETRL